MITSVRGRVLLAVAAGALALLAAGAPARADGAPAAGDIKERLQSSGPLEIGGVRLDRSLLVPAYEARDFAPLWTDRPELEVGLLAALAAADHEGLDPKSFGLGELKVALAGGKLSPIERELLLSDRFLAYAQAAAQGRLAPISIDSDWLLPRPLFDPGAVLGHLARVGDTGAVLKELLPVALDYERLRWALARYQALAEAGGWPMLATDQMIEPGQSGAFVHALRARLVVEGDLGEALGAGDSFDARVTAAVRRFQARHGIAVDGRVGPATLGALNVPVAARIAQIQLTLERWRSLPRHFPATRVVVNVPPASLALYRGDALELVSRVIVGAEDHPTPVLAARIVAVLFNPPWNVPSSITRKEIQPRLRRDPLYLARNHYVIIGYDGDPYGRDVDWKRTNILKRGWRLQQEPGPWNALGGVKFELPNLLDVYLHDTPTRPLFAKPMRAASHGCVRVEGARAMASDLLGGDWPAEAIDRAIDEGATRRVYLKTVMPVYLLYLTTFVDEDGTVEFRDDIYGRDGRLAAALAELDQRRRLASMRPPG